jgi:hypothetical protein
MWLYAGSANSTRESIEELNDAEVDARIKTALEVGVIADTGPHLTPLR